MALKVDYMVRETGINLIRNISLTIASILTVAVSLSMVGGSLLLRDAVDNATRRWEGGIEFIVFLNPDATQDQRGSVQRLLDEAPQVDNWIFFDTEDSFEEFQELFEGTPQVVESVRPEDIPTSFRVVPTDKSPEVVQGLTDVFANQPGVREVVAPFEAIRTIRDVSNIVGIGLLALAVVLLAAASLLILNSIRMAMFARRREIEVMKLVGASNWFVRIPFMLEGIVQGIVGSTVAIAVNFGIQSLFDGIASDQRFKLFAGFVVSNSEVTFASIFVLGTGVLIGALGSGFAVSRFLDV